MLRLLRAGPLNCSARVAGSRGIGRWSSLGSTGGWMPTIAGTVAGPRLGGGRPRTVDGSRRLSTSRSRTCGSVRPPARHTSRAGPARGAWRRFGGGPGGCSTRSSPWWQSPQSRRSSLLPSPTAANTGIRGATPTGVPFSGRATGFAVAQGAGAACDVMVGDRAAGVIGTALGGATWTSSSLIWPCSSRRHPNQGSPVEVVAGYRSMVAVGTVANVSRFRKSGSGRSLT
jgi:hypothetical protein